MSPPKTAPLLRLASLAMAALCVAPLAYLSWRAAGEPHVLFAVLRRGSTWAALGRSLGLGVAVAAVGAALALPLAWLTHATDLPGRRAFRVLLILPLSIPSYVGGFVIVAAFAPGGLLPVLDPYSPLGAVLALSFTYPLALLALQAALDRLDPRLWESARSLGCTPRQAFVRVVLPHLAPALGSGALLTGLYAIGDFGAVSLTRYESLSYLVYLRHKSLFERAEAAPLSLLLIALCAALAWLATRTLGRGPRALRAEQRAWPVIALGALRWPCAVACGAAVALLLVAPVTVVIGWLVQGMRLGNAAPFPWQSAGHSVALGLGAVVVVVPLAFVPALADRGGGALARLLAYLGYALPGIALALALVSLATGSAWAAVLYQSYPLLLAAYAIRFVSLGVEPLQDALAAGSPNLYWAARSLGASPLRAWLRVLLPLTRPAVVAGAIGVFVAVIKELPATLLLAPIGVSTLAARIWALTEDAYFTAAAPCVLTLMGLSALLVALKPDVRRGEAMRGEAMRGEAMRGEAP